MARQLRVLFIVHLVIAAALGLLLLIMPGRFLLALGWAPIDPILSRVLGAALLALGWGSYRAARLRNPAELHVLLEVDLAFCALGTLGVLRHIVVAHWPWMVWALLVVLVAWTAAWAWVRARS